MKKIREEFIKILGCSVENCVEDCEEKTENIIIFWLNKLAECEAELVKRVYILRQLLNEDRITDPKKMIDNEYILEVLLLNNKK